LFYHFPTFSKDSQEVNSEYGTSFTNGTRTSIPNPIVLCFPERSQEEIEVQQYFACHLFLSLTFPQDPSYMVMLLLISEKNPPSPEFLAQNHVPEILFWTLFTSIFSSIFVLGRFYSRAVILKTWGADDWWILISWVGAKDFLLSLVCPY